MATFFRPRIVKMMGRPSKYLDETAAQKQKFRREDTTQKRLTRIAVLDFETDPFDSNKPELKIAPFAGCLYSKHFEPKVIWNSEPVLFVEQLLKVLDELIEPHLIFAHNGGKFDFMFLVNKMRGKVSFKGRGIMSAKIGKHELRDSFHLIPEKLAAYKKDVFSYEKLVKSKREKYKPQIIEYMKNDCVYLYDIVTSFLKEFGFKISIGQAAMSKLKESYTVGTIGENTDEKLREYFFGGRVECLAGRGHFIGDYKLYDVNSMYPFAMATFLHPISSTYNFRRTGGITASTFFIDLTCTNRGALVKRGSNNETSAKIKHGRFKTSIYEFRAAVELGLIDDIQIHGYVDNLEGSNFEKFIHPLYAKRQLTKVALDTLDEANPAYNDTVKESIFLKLLMNNAYGKFAQNPRRYKDSFITEAGDSAPKGFEETILPKYRCADYDIWEKSTNHKTYNNVGTAASITGAARSILMRAIHGSIEPIYCDTDSLICKSLNATIDPSALGAWKHEKSFDEVIIAGKKLYATKQYGVYGKKDIIKVKSKGAPKGALKWKDMLDILDGKTISVTSMGPTLTKTGKQYYMTRSIKATV